MIDISFNGVDLEKKLSNLYPYEFEIDGVIIKSMEGFLQSLKTNDIYHKQKLWKLSGGLAWKYGQQFNWKEKQTLYWQNKEINRHSNEYQKLIEYSYDRLFKNKEFVSNLKESIGHDLNHTIGNTNPYKTVLTKYEFLDNLNRLRDKLKPERFYNLF
ncbi:hypothetical protein [Trichloromonas sp.]|uniref:hypothetical protein n=1 Tax=Trichloromonas sp. TaxID=3069249 RepID=UPI002A3B9EFD|nr:hypothetical protein [Trichloromonas sp.]